MRAAVFAYSRTGCAAARRVKNVLPEMEITCYTMARFEEAGFLSLDKGVYAQCFTSMDALIFVGACGIAVREIAPYVRDKRTDPAVLCMDERETFVIPLLSGHIGGANQWAVRLAERLGATAAVTTATDVNGKFSVDAWAAEHGCAIVDMRLAKKVSARILERDVPLLSEFPIVSPLPRGTCAKKDGSLGILIGCHLQTPFKETLRLVPKLLRVGVGCRRGAPQASIEAAICAAFENAQLDQSALKGVYSIDLKRQEEGLLAACRKNGWPLRFYTADELRAAEGVFTASEFVRSVTGVENVCERAALLGAERLIVKKTVFGGVTVAVAAEHWEVRFE